MKGTQIQLRNAAFKNLMVGSQTYKNTRRWEKDQQNDKVDFSKLMVTSKVANVLAT